MHSLQTVVPRALTELFRQSPMSQGKLEVAWRVSVGDALSRVTTVRLQPDGSVEVHPADQRWYREVERSSGIILTRLQDLLGTTAVTHLSIIDGPAERPSRIRPTASGKASTSAEATADKTAVKKPDPTNQH
jgi:hypothetical protein